MLAAAYRNDLPSMTGNSAAWAAMPAFVSSISASASSDRPRASPTMSSWSCQDSAHGWSGYATTGAILESLSNSSCVMPE